MKKLIILLIFLFIPHLVSAGIISLTTTVSTDIMTEDSTKIHVKLLNSGDEPAYNVQMSLLLSSSFNSEPIFIETLNPNEPFEADFDVTLTEEIIPGNYPIVILTDYADANGYPFSSVSPSFIVYQTRKLSKVSGGIPTLSLSGKKSKNLILNIRNLDDIPHDVEVKLFLPRELKVVDEERTLSIGAKDEEQLNFEVSSLSALTGSSYIVLASMEYEYEDSHYSSFGRGVIKIEEEKPFEFSIWIPILSFCVLLIIFLYYFIRRK